MVSKESNFVVLLLVFVQIVSLVSSHNIVTLEDISVSPPQDGEQGSIDVRVRFSTADSLSDTPGFRKADWQGMSSCNYLSPCDWIGVWKADPADSTEGCVATAEGWNCPAATQYTSGTDLVKRAGMMSVDTTSRVLTPTSGDAKYHVYYCLTGRFIRKWNQYECIARTEFRLPKPEQEREEAEALKHHMEAKDESGNMIAKVELRSEEYEKNSANVVQVPNQMSGSAIQATVTVGSTIPTSLESGFVGVFKVRGEDSKACMKITEEQNEDGAQFICTLSQMWTKIEDGYIAATEPDSTNHVNLRWGHAPKMDALAGYAVFFCMSSKWSLLSLIISNNEARCFARTALFGVKEQAEDSTLPSPGTQHGDVDVGFSTSQCIAQPPKKPGFVRRAGSGVAGMLYNLPGFGLNIADRVMGVFTPNDNSVIGLKQRYFSRFSNVVELYGMIIGYDSVRILNTQGKVRVTYKNKKLHISAFKNSHDAPNLVNDESCDRASVVSLDLDLVNVKLMTISDSSKWIGSPKIRLKIDLAFTISATYLGGKHRVESDSNEFDAEFFDSLLHSEDETSEIPIVVGTMCKVRLAHESDDPSEFRYEGKVTKIHEDEDGTKRYDIKFGNGETRESIQDIHVKALPKSQWRVNPKDIKICITDVDIQMQSGGAMDWLHNPSTYNALAYSLIASSSKLGTHTFLVRKLFKTYIHQILHCYMSRGLDGIGQFGVLAKAEEYQIQIMKMVSACIQDPTHAYCTGLTRDTMEMRLERYKRNPHNLQLLLEFHLEDRDTPQEHLSVSLQTDLDTSSSGLLRMAIDPMMDILASSAPPESSDGNLVSGDSSGSSDSSGSRSEQDEPFFDAEEEHSHRFKGLNKNNNHKKTQQHIRRRKRKAATTTTTRHLLMEEEEEYVDSSDESVEISTQDPLFDLYQRVKLDLTQFAELSARANRETSVMIKTLGNFLLRGEANLDFTMKGSAIRLNPDLEPDSKICLSHESRGGSCENLVVVESDTFTFKLDVPEDHIIMVPFRWAILDQPFGDWSLADRERWSEAFEYYGSSGVDIENIVLHGPMRSGLTLLKRELERKRTGGGGEGGGGGGSENELENALRVAASSSSSTDSTDSTNDEISSVPSMATMVMNDFLESGIDTLLDQGVSLALEVGNDKGVHIDKEFLNFHYTINFKGPTNLENIARWILETVARSKVVLEDWARLRLEERARMDRLARNHPPEGPAEPLVDILRTMSFINEDEHQDGPGSPMSHISDLTNTESGELSFLELKAPSPCNKRMKNGGLDRIEFCKECVAENPPSGSILTWSRKKMLRTVTTRYHGCYWSPNERKCRMNTEREPVSENEKVMRGGEEEDVATSIKSCDAMYTEEEYEGGDESGGGLEDLDLRSDEATSTVSFDESAHNPVRVVILVRQARNLANTFVSRYSYQKKRQRGETGARLGDDCVDHLNEQMSQQYHVEGFIEMLARASCIRAAAKSIVLGNDGRIEALQSKTKMGSALKQSDFPSNYKAKWVHPLNVGPMYGGTKDNEILKRFLVEFENWEVEGLGPQCGMPSVVSSEGASLMRTSGALKETCVQLWAGYLKMWHGIGIFPSERYGEIQLCSSTFIGRRLTLSVSDTVDKAIQEDRFDKRFLFLDLQNINMDLPQVVEDGVELKTPVVNIRLQELSVRKGTVKRRGFIFHVQKKSQIYKLKWNNLDDFATVSTIINYILDIENVERRRVRGESTPEDEESPSVTSPDQLSIIQEKVKELIDETLKVVNDVLEDKWWAKKMPRKRYPIRWVSSWPLPYVGKIAVGTESAYLSESDIQIRMDTSLALTESRTPRVRIWIGSSNEVANDFDQFAALVDICDASVTNTKESFASLGAVAQNMKIIFNSKTMSMLFKASGGVLKIPSLSLDFKAGIYAILEWDVTKKTWSMKNENVKFCVPRDSDEFLSTDISVKRKFRDQKILQTLVTSNWIKNDYIIDWVVPILRSQIFCAIELYLLGVSDHLPVDTEDAQSKAEPSLVAILLSGLLEDIRSTPEDETKRFYMSLKIRLSDVGTTREKLIVHFDHNFDVSTEALFESLLHHDKELLKYLRRQNEDASAEEQVESIDASEDPQVAAIARYVGRWAERLDSSNSGFLPTLIGMFAKLFYVGHSNLQLQMDASVLLDMHSNDTLLDTMNLDSKQIQLSGNADDIPVPLGSLMGLPEMFTESVGISDHEIDYDDFRFNVSKLNIGTKPFHMKGPAMGTILDTVHAMCVQGEAAADSVRISEEEEIPENGITNEEEEQAMTLSCEFLLHIQRYLNDNDVKVEIKARDHHGTAGSGIFMDRNRFQTSLSGKFEGATDITEVSQLLTQIFLVNNGEISGGGDEEGDDDSLSDDGTHASGKIRSALMGGMRGAISFVHRAVLERRNAQREMFGVAFA